MGMRHWYIYSDDTDNLHSLLHSPFDYAQAFDHALKEIIVALPGRPSIESAENAVKRSKRMHIRILLIFTRCTTVPSLAASESMPAIHGH